MDLSSKCTLACPYCARANIENIPSNIMSEEDFDKYLDFFDRLIFCGQISDPMMHPKLPLFLQKAYEAGKTCSVHVAASHRPKEFFIKCFEANPDATWYFGIDGLPQDSHKYRVRQDGQKMFDMMVESVKYLKQKPMWQYILFNYNENDVDEAKELSLKHGVNIQTIVSSRWDDTGYLRPSTKNSFNNYQSAND